MLKKRKFIIAAAIVVLAMGFLGYRSFVASATYYYTVSEFTGQEASFGTKAVRLSGTVAEGTIDRQGNSVKFTITDGQKSLPIAFKGVIPDSFKEGAEAVVEGKLNSAGTFEATTLLAKCPSKYEAAADPNK